MKYGKIKNDHIISDMVVYLTTLYNGGCSSFDIKKTAKVIMASFHDKENAHEFLVKLSTHVMTAYDFFELVKKAYSEIYDEFEDELSTDHRIKEIIIEFADEISYHLMRITDIYKTDVTYIAYMLIFNSIKLFTYESDVTIFAARLTGKIYHSSLYPYVGKCLSSFQYMRRMVPSDKVNLTLDVMETPNKEGVKYREEED